MLQASVSFTSVEREKNVIYHMARNICVYDNPIRGGACVSEITWKIFQSAGHIPQWSER